MNYLVKEYLTDRANPEKIYHNSTINSREAQVQVKQLNDNEVLRQPSQTIPRFGLKGQYATLQASRSRVNAGFAATGPISLGSLRAAV